MDLDCFLSDANSSSSGTSSDLNTCSLIILPVRTFSCANGPCSIILAHYIPRGCKWVGTEIYQKDLGELLRL